MIDLFRLERTSFNLVNALVTFKRMGNAFLIRKRFCRVYFADIIIFSKGKEERVENVVEGLKYR